MNYTRDLWKYLSGMTSIPKDQTGAHVTLLAGLAAAKKFELPEGGMVMEDPKLRGLDTTEPLHFPFEQMTLEYPERETVELETTGGHRAYLATKKVICVGTQPQLVPQEDKGACVDVVVFAYIPSKHLWFPVSTFLLTLDDWNTGRGADELITLKFLKIDPVSKTVGNVTRAHGGPPMVLAQFLNMLSCSNVECHPRKKPKPGKRALPFDYWVLTIEKTKTSPKGSIAGALIVDRRSPREPVRRGHIRHYTTGLKTWVNATAINPGTTGKVTKTYKVKKGPK
jgi:hypothetical protein